MRHFLIGNLAPPSLLPSGVLARPTRRTLVGDPRSANGFPSSNALALARAVDLPPVAPRAHAHLAVTAGAMEQARSFDHRRGAPANVSGHGRGARAMVLVAPSPDHRDDRKARAATRAFAFVAGARPANPLRHAATRNRAAGVGLKSPGDQRHEHSGSPGAQSHGRFFGSTICVPAGMGRGPELEGAGAIAIPLNSLGLSGEPESGTDREPALQAAIANIMLGRRRTIEQYPTPRHECDGARVPGDLGEEGTQQDRR